MYAKIIIDIKHEDVNHFYDYIIPSSLEDDIKKGMRVVVPFGHQMRMGYVIELMNESHQAQKEIIELLDVIPTVTDETFMLIDHLLEKTNDLYSAVFETVVPAEIGLDYFQDICLVKPELVDEEFRKIFNRQGKFKRTKTKREYDHQIRKYLKLEAVTVTSSWQPKVSEKQVNYYTYNRHHTYHRITNYPLVDLLKDDGYQKKDLIALGFTDSHISTLLKHDVLVKEKVTVTRDIKHIYEPVHKEIILTDEQQKVYASFHQLKHEQKPFLLKGVTGSGKTELYLKWMKDAIDQHKQVMILVPEIALIAPMAQRLESTFKEIAIYHSHLSKGERFDQYMKIKQGQINILLGTRSAVFMPFERLGLIVIDECHDASYVQTDHVPYDALEMAMKRAKYHQCPIVLGSATPNVSTMYHAKQGDYHLLSLNERPFEIKQPIIHMVDMKEELKQKNTSMFSRTLRTKIEDRLQKHEQVMILFNRKGYAPFVMCRQCGYVPTCPTCGIALTYYKDKNQLKCHYCGYEESYQSTCASCHSQAIKPVGVGIEQVEKELHKAFPEAKVLRMDSNMTRTKGAHEIIWHDFANQKADILLGTQMIAKGLDFPHVTLVGILMADLMLRTPSYQSSEEAFILLTQAAGRSARYLPGEVIIQGYDLDHYAIKDVLKGYDSFYEEAIYDRKISGYEPFNRVYQVLAEGESYLKTYQQAFNLKKALSADKDYHILGPVPAYIKKKGEKYRFVLTIKTTSYDTKHILTSMKQFEQGSISFRFYPLVQTL